MKCKIHNCESQSCKKSYCNKHYIKLRRYGDPIYLKHNDICIVTDCEKPYHSNGYCKIHYRRMWKNNSLEKKSLRKYEVDHDFFSRDTEESFYWAGFLAADGSVCKSKKCNTHYITLVLAKKDESHLIKYKKAIKAEYPIYQRFSNLNGKKYPRVDLAISSKKMFEDLARFGIVPNKSLIMEFPNWLINHPLVNHFIRGYFDGDGTISKIYKNSVFIDILGTELFLNTMSKIVADKCNIAFKNSRKRNKSKIFDLRYGGNALPKKILNFFYKDATTFLDRKKSRFDDASFNIV